MDEVKELIGQAQRRPWTGNWRVILVEDADRMAERTTNVLLKSIEEPPPQTDYPASRKGKKVGIFYHI